MNNRSAVLSIARSALIIPFVIPLGLSSAAAPARALHALRLVPAPGSREVAPGALVSVVFDRPAVALARLGSGPPAATISPPVPGQARWLGTTTWAILPANGLAPATTYTVRLNPALRGPDGTPLANPTMWTFSTVRPAVSSAVPADGTDGVLPRAPVDITFNVPVVHPSAQAHFSLRRSGSTAPLAGTFTWRNARTMRFTPSAPLPRGATLIVRESPGVLATGGPLPGLRSFSGSFRIVPAFAFKGSEPGDGATASDPYVTVFLHFTAPVDLRAASRYVRVQPAVDALHIDVADQNTLTLDGDFQPSTAYRVTISAGLPDLLGDHLAATRVIHFSTPAYQPTLQLAGTGALDTYDAYRGVRLFASAINVTSVTFSVYRQNEAQFLKTSSPAFDRSTYTPDGLPLVARYTQTVRARRNHTVILAQRLTDKQGAALAPGYYAVFASAPNVSSLQSIPLLVTRSSLTLKVGDNSVLLWASDLRGGTPLAYLPVRVVDDKGHLILRGQTGADGIFRGTVGGNRHLSYQTLRAIIDRPRDAAVAGSDWNSGISPYDYRLNFDPALAHVRMYFTTDRPIYRPGQTVYFRGIVRGDDDGRYHLLPAGTRVHLVVTDAMNHTILDGYGHVNSHGIVSGVLPLSTGAAIGTYALQATIGGESSGAYFSVAAYKKPTFRVLVLPDHGDNGSYVQGQQISATAHADYYFGVPLARAPVIWHVSSAATSFQPDGYDGYSFYDAMALNDQFQTPAAQQILQVTDRTGPSGETTVRLRASTGGSPFPQAYTVEADISGPDHQDVAERSTVTVHPAAVYVGLRPQNYLATPKTPQAVDVVSVRPDGSPAPHTAVTLQLQRQRTDSVLRYDPQLGYIWINHTRNDTIATFTVRTDASGHTVVRVTLPNAGQYRLAASARDALGNNARTAAYLYSEAAGNNNGYVDWGLSNNDRITLVADRRQYNIGDTAHVLVAAPFAGMRALVTLERGTVLSYRTVTLRGNSPVLSIPITAATVPNVYVSIVLFRGSGASASALPVWKMGYTTLAVNARERALVVRIHPLAAHARPGQRVRFAIHTQDAYGHPVAADVGVALVDAAVLALASNANGTAGSVFYAQRPLGISTAASMALYIDRLNLTPGEGKKGGGAGGGGGPGGGLTIRTKFPDTAYWNPDVRTNAAGNATVAVTLPDNLTVWHLSAEGSTAGTTLLGAGGADIVSTKPVLIEPALPRFLTLRDHGKIGAVVSNTTDAPTRLRVSGRVDNGAATQTLPARLLTIPAHQDRTVLWAYAPAQIGSIRVQVQAVAGSPDLSDALAVSVPVKENSMAEAAATAGDSTAAVATEHVRLPTGIEAGEGALQITLEPSLVAGLGSAADDLLSYPYNCVEQMTSRLTGLLALHSLPARTFGLNASQAQALPGLIARTSAQLYALQNGDGGWGWWPESRSDPYLSAYAFDGLLFLRDSGHTVDARVLGGAARYLRGRLAAVPGDPYAPDDATRAYILYTLGRAGQPDGAASAALYERRRGLDPGARANLALALSAAFGQSDPRVRTVIHELSAATRLTPTDAHWDMSGSGNRETMETSTGDTALVTRMLVNLDPRNPLIPRAVRWLMAQRGRTLSDITGTPGGAWESTQATALALRALAFYALHNGDTHPRYSYRIVVNGRVLSSGTVTPGTAGQLRQASVSLDTLRADGGAATVTISRQGMAGATPLHYTVRMRYYPLAATVGAIDSGLQITRRYLDNGGHPVGGTAVAGRTLTVELRLVAPQDLSRVLIEDPLPAGAEAVDGTLLTSSVFARPGGTAAPPWQYVPGQPQELSWYVDHTELRDDRAALFATYIPAGVYVYRYTIHLAIPGTYHVLPAQAMQMYEPEVFGHTAEGSFTVTA